MDLLHINMIVMSIACVLLLVGFSLRAYAWAPGLMLLGALAMMGLIVYDVKVLSTVS